MLKLLVCSSIVLASVLAQIPRPCESPKAWQGREATFDESRKFRRFAQLTYDETNRRTRRVEDLAIGSKEDFYDVLHLHNEKKEYRLNLRTNVCNVTALTRPFVPIGFPPDAKFSDSFVIGLAGFANESVTAISFDGETDAVKFYGIVSTPDCVPIQFKTYSQQYGLAESQFFDIKAGIPNPNVFVPPSQCSRQ